MVKGSGSRNSQAGEQRFTVPADMVMDILFVLVENNIFYKIIKVNRDDGYVMLHLNSHDQPHYYHRAVENIEVMLDEYNDFVRLCEVR